MIVIQIPIIAKPKPMASIVIGRGVEWQTAPAVMLETEAIVLAAECRKRGLTARVESHG